MNLYKIKPQFDPDTGEPSDPTLKVDRKRAVCDFSGEEYDIYDSDEHIPTYNISIQYNNSSEPNWYEDYHKFEEDFGITYESFAEFMESPYHFMHTEECGVSDLTFNLVREWISHINNGVGKFKDCLTIEQVLTLLRLKNLRNLLEKKRYTPEQLGLEVGI
jgi:hypothetical protein